MTLDFKDQKPVPPQKSKHHPQTINAVIIYGIFINFVIFGGSAVMLGKPQSRFWSPKLGSAL